MKNYTDITFQPLSELHFSLLLKWLRTPHVKVWWDQNVDWTPQLIETKYSSYVQGYKRLKLHDQTIEKPIYAYIIALDNVSIGYIQYYKKHDFPPEQGYETQELPKNCAAIDWYIGERDYTGRGIGPQALKTFLESQVFPNFNIVFVDPDTANKNAIRAYEKAGFKTVKLTNDGAVTWMLKEREYDQKASF